MLRRRSLLLLLLFLGVAAPWPILPQHLSIRGVACGMSRSEVEKLLGAPTESSDLQVTYPGYVHVEYDQAGRVMSAGGWEVTWNGTRVVAHGLSVAELLAIFGPFDGGPGLCYAGGRLGAGMSWYGPSITGFGIHSTGQWFHAPLLWRWAMSLKYYWDTKDLSCHC